MKGTEWKSTGVLIYEHRHHLRDLFLNDELRIRIQFFCIYPLFAIVSMLMTLVNLATGYRLLMYSTFLFGVANLVNFFLAHIGPRADIVARVLFSAEIIALFTFFVVVGEPEGFSAIWMVLLPSCGLLLYRLIHGMIMSFIQFAILVFFFWTPIGQSYLQYAYTTPFLSRLPLLYVACLAIGVFFESVRYYTQQELAKTQEEYRYLSRHDILTGLRNRAAFDEDLKALVGKESQRQCALAIMDLDSFKQVNDSFGHHRGDEVLKSSANALKKCMEGHGTVYRWGGEEFSFFIKDAREASGLSETLRKVIASQRFSFEGQEVRITASIGVVTFRITADTEPPLLLAVADENLYCAKNKGKNCIVTTPF